MSDVTRWLEGLGLGEYAAAFAEHRIDRDVLPSVTADDLREIGVVAVGDRRKLLRAIAALVEAGDRDPPGPTAPEPAAEPHRGPSPDTDTTAERRQLTILFADLAGSTALSTRLDSEELREVIRAFQESCTTEIERFGGFVAKYMGDGLLAYFGYPEAHEDDAERAVNAGLALASVERRTPGNDEPLSVRVGIATGLVVVGDVIGRGAAQEAAVVGETPNLAARLQALAGADTVVVDSATEALAGGHFELCDLGFHELKGFAGTVQAWAVRGRRQARSRFAAAHRGDLSELVGREEELALVLQRWHQVEDGEGQLVVVTGEPGIGKSRLAHAVDERIGEDGILRLSFQCSPFHVNTSLHPILEEFERLAGFEPGDSDDDRLEAIRVLLARAGRPAEQDLPLLAPLLTLPNPAGPSERPAPPPQHQARIIEALKGTLLGLAADRPSFFLLEDVHWADPSTLDLIDALIDGLAAAPVLVLVTHRYDFRTPWIGRSPVTLVALNRLGRRDCEALAERIGGGTRLPDAVVDQIVEKTDGVPLFVEEFTRAAVESGATEGRLAIPTTLKDALEARLGRLGTAREVAQLASALGRSFEYALLREIDDGDEPRLRRSLGQLVDAQLLFVRGEPPEARYTFKHALVQETAYESLLRSRRTGLHARIAGVLKERFPRTAADEPELVAHHLTRAGRIEDAIEAWRRAGDNAVGKFAATEAIGHFQQAVELLRSLSASDDARARELELLLRLAPLHMMAKAFGAPEAEHAYRRALEVADDLGDPAQAFTAQWGLWMIDLEHPKKDAGKRIVGRLLAMSEASGDRDQQLQAHHASWSTHFFHGEFDTCRQNAETGIALYDPELHADHRRLYGGHDPGTCCRNFLGLATFIQGDAEAAIASLADAHALARGLGHPPSLLTTFNLTAMLRIMLREPDQAQAPIEQGISLARENEIPTAMWASSLRGWIVGRFDSPAEGLALMRSDFEATGAVGQEAMRSFYQGLMAELCGRAGRAEEGLLEISRALELSRRKQRHWYLAELHRIRGELLRDLGRPSQDAEASFQEAISIAHRQRARMWHLRAATGLARMWTDQNRVTEARDLLEPVCRGFRKASRTVDLDEARSLLKDLG